MRSSEKGLTLIEILVALAVFAIIFVVAQGAFLQFDKTALVSKEAQEIRALILEARSKTLLAENDNQYGVHFETNAVTLFVGGNYSASDPENEVNALHSRVTLSAIIIATTTDDIVFKKVTGVPSSYGTTTVTHVGDNSLTKDIVITPSGAVYLSE